MNQDSDASTSKRGGVEHRGASALDRVVEQRRSRAAGGDRRELVFGLDCFDEDDVGARAANALAVFDRLVESPDGERRRCGR